MLTAAAAKSTASPSAAIGMIFNDLSSRFLHRVNTEVDPVQEEAYTALLAHYGKGGKVATATSKKAEPGYELDF